MKTQFKRLSKSTLAVILSVCLLFSCMTVGIIATDAAKTFDESVGATARTVYITPASVWSNYKSTDTIKICSKPDKKMVGTTII